MADKTQGKDIVVAGLARGAGDDGHGVGAPAFVAEFECIGPDGMPKWRSKMHNVVMAEGKAEILNRFFGQKTNAAWYLGLASSNAAGSTTNSACNLSNLAASEVTGYGAARPTLGFTTNYSSNITTASSSASYGISVAGPVNVGGAFICGAAQTSSTAQANGVLYSFGTFASRALVSNDSLNVTVTVSFA